VKPCTARLPRSSQEGADVAPPGSVDVGLLAGTERLEEEAEEVGALLAEVVLPDELGAEQLLLLTEPFAENLRLVAGQDVVQVLGHRDLASSRMGGRCEGTNVMVRPDRVCALGVQPFIAHRTCHVAKAVIDVR
jgi:hypothetical protein